MKRCRPLVPLLLLAAALPIHAQSPQSTTVVVHGWLDSDTGLMWAMRDNGKDVSWKGAGKYCRKSRVDGYSDWRLASLQELEGIFDGKAETPGAIGNESRPGNWHVKGNIFLTGNQWSSTPIYNDQGKPSGYRWHFDFNEGRSIEDPTGFFYPFNFMRALCVRGTVKSAQPTPNLSPQNIQ